MTQKRTQRGSGASLDPDELARLPLQAILLADSFALKFRPITLERPKVLLPLVNVPMIEYTLAWLESVGVEEVFVFCCAHAQMVKDYLNKSEWTKQTAIFSITIIESRDAISAGDALRRIYDLHVIRGDFVLVSGDTVSNMSLTQAIQEHKERRKKDPLAIMTMVIRHSKSSVITHQTRFGTEEVFMVINSETKELLHYEDKTDNSPMVSLEKMLLANNSALHLHNDKEDCYIDICSPEVLSLFTDNFDYQHLRRHFVKGLLSDDIMGYKIYTHETHSSYVARIDNFRSYDTISKDIIQQWAYPFVPSTQYFEKCSSMKLDREGVYKAPDVVQSRSAQIGALTFIGSGTTIGDNSMVSNSVIGQGCIIGRNVQIHGSYIWDNVIIEDGCKLSYALVCDGVQLRAGADLKPGVILSFKVEVGQQITIPAYSKVSMLPEPSIQDSDEELEYADSNSLIVDSPSISSVITARNSDLNQDTSAKGNSISEDGISGVGYIWSTSEGGDEEEWRYSIAPIPTEKLLELLKHDQDDADPGSQPSEDAQLNPENCTDDEDENNFEKEVESTFQRLLAGVDEENVILEINSLRLSYNMQHTDCAGAVFYSIVKSALSTHSKNSELHKDLVKEIRKRKGLLKRYLITIDEEIEVVLKFEEICLKQDKAKELASSFSLVLQYLYDEDILSEEAILQWAEEQKGGTEEEKKFLSQSEQFIRWLEEASEEEDEDD